MDEGLDAGERVSKKKKRTLHKYYTSKIDTVSILTTTQKMSLS